MLYLYCQDNPVCRNRIFIGGTTVDRNQVADISFWTLIYIWLSIFFVTCIIFIITSSKMTESRRNWSDFEDKAIMTLVKKYGTKNWAEISEKMSSKYGIDYRTGKQCRERWHNHLDPEVNKEEWSAKEEKTMFEAHQRYGNRWTEIAKLFDGRTDNDIKNHFYSMLRRSLRRVNKLLGMRNSTQKIKLIKPSVLSKIFINIGNDDQEKSVECKKIAEALFEFSKSKTSDDLSTNLMGQQKKRLEDLIERLAYYNQQYQMNQLIKRQSRKSQKNEEVKIQQPVIKKIASNISIASNKSKQSLKSSKRKSLLKKNSTISIKQQNVQQNPKISRRGRKKKAVFCQQKRQEPKVETPPECLGPFTRLKKKDSQFLNNMQQEFVLPDLFELPSYNDLERRTSSFSDMKKKSSSGSGGPNFYFNDLSAPSPKMDLRFLARTPQGPTPNISDLFNRNIMAYQWKANNEELDGILSQTKRAIEKSANR